jgi:hypothetical protein
MIEKIKKWFNDTKQEVFHIKVDLPEVHEIDIRNYLAVSYKQGAKTLSMLGKLRYHFELIYKSDVGQHILGTSIVRMEHLLEKVYREEATQQELAEFRFLRDKHFPQLLHELDLYIRKVGEIKLVSNKAA